MAVSFVAASARTTANATSVATSSRAITLPTGVASGDIVLLLVQTQDDLSVGTTKSSLTVPSQWTALSTSTFTTTGMLDSWYVDCRVYWARAPLTAGSMSWKSGDYSTILYHTVAYRGASSANPPFESVTATAINADASNSGSASVPAIPVSNSDTSVLALALQVGDGSSLALTAAGGWTRRTNLSGSSSGIYLQNALDLAVASPSSTATTKFPYTGNSRVQGRLITAAFLPAGAGGSKGSINVNVGGTWKAAQSLWVNSAGTWKQAQSVFTNVGGTWKQVL